jgi:hypothetical protein
VRNDMHLVQRHTEPACYRCPCPGYIGGRNTHVQVVANPPGYCSSCFPNCTAGRNWSSRMVSSKTTSASSNPDLNIAAQQLPSGSQIAFRPKPTRERHLPWLRRHR